MIKDGIEYTKCPANENCCRCFTGDESDDCYWRLKL